MLVRAGKKRIREGHVVVLGRLSSRDREVIARVFSLGSEIRYCSVIDKEGRVVLGGMKKGVKSLEPPSEAKRLITQFAILMGTDKDWERYLGRTDYFLIRKSKVDLFLFPVAGLKGVLVSTKPSFPKSKTELLRKTIDEVYAR